MKNFDSVVRETIACPSSNHLESAVERVVAERYGGARKERTIMYHGTKFRRIRSILSRGLIPFPEEREWASDPDASLHRVSRVSYGGSYLTTNLALAVISANRGLSWMKKVGREPTAIVIIDVQPRSLVADEDDVTDLGSIINVLGFREYYDPSLVVDLWFAAHGARYRDVSAVTDMEKSKDGFVIRGMRRIEHVAFKGVQLHPKLRKRLESLLRDTGWLASLTRAVAYYLDPKRSDEYYVDRERPQVAREALAAGIEIPSIAAG